MDISGNLLIIVGIVIVVLGIFAGMLLSTLREEGEPEEGSDEQAPPGGRAGRYTPVARLWRDKGTGALVVEMEGKSFLLPDPMSADQRGRLEQTARDLRAWLGMGIAAAQPETAPPAPAPQAPGAGNNAGGNLAAEPAPAAPAQPYSALPSSPPSIPPAPLRAASSVKVAPPPEIVRPEAPALSGKSIVMQIEDILQDMIAGTPIAQRGLHLLEDPVRGVLVQVGANQYEGIDAVPEPEVQATIRAAVDEWEKSQ